MKDKLMKTMKAVIIAMFVIMPIFSFVLVSPAAADDLVGLDPIAGEIALGDTDPRTMAASIINVAMGFLGIIAVVIILLGGFKWMTAGGNEDKVGEARSLIGAGIIGLIIILASWSIATFVLNQLVDATGAA